MLKNLIQELHRIRCMDERSSAQLVKSVDQKPRRNVHRLRHVVELCREPFPSIPYRSTNTTINDSAISKQGFDASVPIFFRSFSHVSPARPSQNACSSASAASRIARLVSGSLARAKSHGWWFAPLGAEPAASTQPSITARSMGASEKSRAVCRVARRSR